MASTCLVPGVITHEYRVPQPQLHAYVVIDERRQSACTVFNMSLLQGPREGMLRAASAPNALSAADKGVISLCVGVDAGWPGCADQVAQ